jgi:hypothetical protein
VEPEDPDELEELEELDEVDEPEEEVDELEELEAPEVPDEPEVVVPEGPDELEAPVPSTPVELAPELPLHPPSTPPSDPAEGKGVDWLDAHAARRRRGSAPKATSARVMGGMLPPRTSRKQKTILAAMLSLTHRVAFRGCAENRPPHPRNCEVL